MLVVKGVLQVVVRIVFGVHTPDVRTAKSFLNDPMARSMFAGTPWSTGAIRDIARAYQFLDENSFPTRKKFRLTTAMFRK